MTICASDSPTIASLRKTPLHHWHVGNGGKMVPFAGYELPVHYRTEVIREHLHTRTAAGLFDVSHMGIAFLDPGDTRHETAARALETLVPADILNMAPGQQRYTQLLDDEGGIRDDLMVWRPPHADTTGTLGIVVNAACKDADYAYLQARLPESVALIRRDDLALFALQGPAAEAVLAVGAPQVTALRFMQVATTGFFGVDVQVSRCGYTGEDGFEIAVAAADSVEVWTRLVGDERVLPIGLGARDTLRLEAGLCLYGHDIDATTSPVEANLVWSIQKRRRREGGFAGARRVLRELRDGPERLRVGLRPAGRAPVRDGAALYEAESAAVPAGTVTSGGYGPSLGAPIAMGYVPRPLSDAGTRLFAEVRGRRLPIDVHPLPFIANRFKR